MVNYRSQTGKIGENIACEYLVKNKYKIIERNFRQKWGELDIIAKAPDKTLVFVEVKTVRDVEKLHTKNENKHQISAEDQLTKSKLQKLQRTASLYAGHWPELINDNKGWRIDLIAIILNESVNPEPAEGLTINDKSYVINHYQNIAF